MPSASPSTDELNPRAGDIAIVGMSCILPGGVASPEALWALLCEGRDAITEVPADRWALDGVYDPDPQVPGRAVTRWGGFIDGIDLFDPAFFGISPREAALMDPQQRLLLQTAWRALEDAGIPAAQIAGSRTGVYVGISHSDYHGIQKFGRYEIDVHTSTGGALSIAANRLSHRLDLRGPSLAVDTACSSSLVALDLACRAIDRAECGMALVGGVNLMLTPDVTITFSRAAMLSPDGRCKAFDARANGYVRGEGAGVVVLKPLARARADGDRVRAVIRATAVNQDGHTSTLTVPSLDAQVAMLHEVCRRAAVDPVQVGYVEAHGTGTAVGDPIEAQAIGTVFGAPRAAGERCLIGSIKTNIGHLEPAAGIAGLIKAALCVEHGAIPPSLHFTAANPNVDMDAHKLAVCTRLATFPAASAPRLAVVNSFGFGGTNASTLLQEPPRRARERAADAAAAGGAFPIVLPLSAATPASLRANAAALAEALAANQHAVADVAATLALRRDHLAHRAMAIIGADGRAPDILRAFAAGQDPADLETGRVGEAAKVGFVFTGQGAQWWAMGRRLLDADPIFRAAVEACDAGFRALSGWSVIDELRRDEANSRIDSTYVAQPATFALQVGLAARWQVWGIRPAAVIGHSIGEMAAAYVAGALSLTDAIAVVHHRSRLQETTRHQGAMAAVGLAPDAARRLIAEAGLALEIAAINGPELITLGGAPGEIDRLLDLLQADPSRPFGRRLHVDYAFHTRQMDPFAAELRASLAGLAPRAGEIAMYSTVTGMPVGASTLDAAYWWRNMREPVLFQVAVEAAIDDGINTFIEIGAHPVLSGPVRACLAGAGRAGTVVSSLQREAADEACLARALAKLYVNGIAPDWRAVARPGWQFVRLPGQAFETQRLWAESEESRAARFEPPAHPLLGMRLRTSSPRWQAQIGTRLPRLLGDHRIDGATVFPAAAYVEQMLAAARETLGEPPWELESIVFHDALVLPDEDLVQVETSITAERGAIEIASRGKGEAAWMTRASGRVRSWNGRDHRVAPWRPATEPPGHVEHSRFYRILQQEGHEFGPSFRGVRTLWRERGEALGLVTLPAEAADTDRYVLHPALLDACFQVIRGFAELSDDAPQDNLVTLPVSIRRLRLFRPPGTTVLSRATAIEETASELVCDIDIVDDRGHPVAAISGLRCRRFRAGGTAATGAAPEFFREHWVEADRGPSQREATGRSYLVLDGGTPLACELAAALRARGAHVSSEAVDIVAETGVAAIEAALRESGRVDEVVVVAMLDGERSHDAPPQPAVVENLVALLQICARANPCPPITVIAEGVAQCAGDPPRSPLFAPIVGLLRTVQNEMPELKARVIDTDPAGMPIDRLTDEVLREASEPLIALRGDKRLACRLGAVGEESLPFGTTTWQPKLRTPPFRVTMSSPGALDRLRLREMQAPRARPGEVLVEVRAVGLNFRDVMAATGLLPAEAEAAPAWQHLGLECAGVVVEIGDGCDPGLRGRRVVAMTPGALASHVTAPAALVVPIPDALSFADAAALPTAYATAQYALRSLARLQAGETVLIHSATGGVGLAAIAVARRCGARIIATAGRSEKRDYLRARGIADVCDSRSLGFADEVLAATQGRGVDVVLNSLPGPFLEKSLALLAPGGRFLEIGKRDVYADLPIGLRSLRQNAAFFAIDLAGIARERPRAIRAELEAIIHDLDAGTLELLPVALFSSDEVADAFRHFARADHIGKIVITHEQPAQVELDRAASRAIRPDATYLVTGGLGGFGLAIAQWLAGQGARSLALMGRSGDARAEAQSALAAMRAAGIDVKAIVADVSDVSEVAAALDAIAATGRPLRGIVHAAGVIDDALLGDLDADRVRRVFAPKAVGAWHLHALTAGVPLDFFVCCSSVAGLLGSVGQAHYAAANRFLDALAAVRQARHLPALSIAWGPIADAGFLTRRPDIARHLEQSGMRPIPLEAALDALAALLLRTCDTVAVADIAAPLVARALPGTAGAGYLAELVSSDARSSATPESLRARWQRLPAADRPAFIGNFLRQQIGAVLKTAAASIEAERPLAELGLDSLTSFELKNRIESAIDASLPITKFLQKPTVKQLADVIGEKLDQPAEAALRPTARPADTLALMSISQEALWFVDRLDPGNPAYGLAMCIAVRPHLDMDLVDAAFRRVIERHESLRMVFAADNAGPIPRLLEPTAFALARHEAVARDETAFRAELDQEGNRPFDLARGPLVRISIYRRADCDVLLLHFHHIVADAASIVIAAQDMFEAYFALRAGAAPRWPRAVVPPAAFARYQRALVRGTAAQPHVAFWRQQLDRAPPVIPLPTDYPRPSASRSAGRSRTLTIPRALTEAIKRLARREGETLYAVLLAAFNVLLHRLGGGSDIVVGTPTLGRTQPEFADAVGYLVNAVPIRTRIDGGMTFKDVLVQTGGAVRAALEHQEFPFASLVRELRTAREAGINPIFQVMFAMERPAEIDSHGFAATLLNVDGAAIDIREFHIESLALNRNRAQFDLGFVVEEHGGEVFGVIDYNGDLWKAETIDRFAASYASVLEAMAQSPGRPIAEPGGEDGRESVLVGEALPDVPDLMESFHRRVAAIPTKTAVAFGERSWSYRELADVVAATARALREHGIGPGSLVGICMARTANLVAALLATLETGAAYIPLDPAYPPGRLGRILSEAQPTLLISDAANAKSAAAFAPCPVIDLDAVLAAPARGHAVDDPVDGEPPLARSELAYVIHTSGSTGGPLGVEVRRASLSNLLAAIPREVPISAGDVLLAVTTVAFDIAALELLLPLVLGATVVIADEATVADGRRLSQVLRAAGITAMQATPATWQMLIDAGWTGDHRLKALVGGERLPQPLAAALLERCGGVWNLYGPTETTVWSTCARIISPVEPIPIGRPIANTTCRVVDESLEPVPPGSAGELMIGGAGLARRYAQAGELTRARFVALPGEPDACWFRTGDMVRLVGDGLVYLGRRDQQIKVRGHRVELGEIEAALGACPGVREAAAVTAGSDLASMRIVAFVAGWHDGAVATAELRGELARALPAYMVPARIEQLPALPRLPNGKLDRASLARLAAAGAADQVGAEARTPLEKTLVELLRDILRADAVGIHDDFFAIGGTSLLGLRYLARVSEVFGIELGPAELLRAPTVAAMAELIVSARAADPVRAESAGMTGAAAPQWRPLALARAEGAFAAVDAAAVACLPEALARATRAASVPGGGLDPLEPYWLGLCRVLGRTIALVVMPVSERDLLTDAPRSRAAANAAIAYAARLGAGCVALTGLIPSMTDFGRALAPPGGCSVTTGHAATATAVALTVQSACRAAGRDLRDESVVFVGLGAIGTASLLTLLGRNAHPARLVLCDVPAKRGHVEQLAQEIRSEQHFRGSIDIMIRSSLPDEAYQCRLFVCATNVTGVLDVARLRPGSIVIDDSFPLCFDWPSALQRIKTHGDILCASAGSVSVDHGVDWAFALPPQVQSLRRDELVRSMLPRNDMITGCMLSALLPAIAELGPTLGPLTAADGLRYWDAMKQLGVTAAPLHCGPWAATPADIARFVATQSDQETPARLLSAI